MAPNDGVIVAGQVVEQNSGNAIEGAVVEIIDPANLQQTATTDSSGSFSFGLDISETVSVTLEISKQGYEIASTTFKLAEGASADDLNIELISKDAEDNPTNDDDIVEGESGEPAALEVVSISSSIIAISGTGGDESSKFVFAVRDSAGRPVSEGYQVNFSILTGPNGGEYIKPVTDFTNSDGIVQAAIVSGDSAGVVKIKAAINENIKSTPVLVAIGNGFPTSENFHIAPVNRNFEAFGLIAEETVSDIQPNYIVASLGDYNHNPVLPGTVVDFTSTAGNIDASAITDEEGIAIVELRPDGSAPTNHPMGIGYATVTAGTVDENNIYITETTTLLFTTPRAIVNIDQATFDVTHGGSDTITFTVFDQNGYPMAAGTTITVEVGDGLAASGHVNEIMPDVAFMGNGPFIPFTRVSGVTEFAVSLSDANPPPAPEEPGNDVVTVTVISPSGQTSSDFISGTRAKTR
ncbi:MAG TPA: carboxypeptidase-like regulatory domain-containing protein [Balneolaceae bacterium]